MTVATYALCGFSNFGAMTTLVSTLKVMAPSKTSDITKNAYWALLVANVVCDMTACIAGRIFLFLTPFDIKLKSFFVIGALTE